MSLTEGGVQEIQCTFLTFLLEQPKPSSCLRWSFTGIHYKTWCSSGLSRFTFPFKLCLWIGYGDNPTLLRENSWLVFAQIGSSFTWNMRGWDTEVIARFSSIAWMTTKICLVCFWHLQSVKFCARPVWLGTAHYSCEEELDEIGGFSYFGVESYLVFVYLTPLVSVWYPLIDQR